ncbi:hypothetical protein GCK72_019856 [Caenorhabditis remanei]|uniref:Nuclear receptor domain-containing protein n=1 Tax=Caenorhabditis remanei TaxID=31234 RepID=A0A6A5GDZ6_CAERE|nr:hypothetical protein GCK72_019856 [Caenorhabditis remanei]KAF1753300.1 hypothetical protein GCK72_019856 [Caenorhabditis remanei]
MMFPTELALQECVICRSTGNLGFNYGVLTCGACKMFFHRVIFTKKVESYCKYNQNCTSKCRHCRFQRCIQNGMLYTPTENLLNANNQDMLSALIFNLSCLDSNRRDKLFSHHLIGDPTIYELAKAGSLKLEKRPVDYQMDVMEWGYISGIVSVDYMYKLPFIKSLEVDDRAVIFRYCYFYLSLLADSLRAFNSKKEFICFPDGTEVVKLNSPGVTKHFENKIRCRLAGRVNELNITKE